MDIAGGLSDDDRQDLRLRANIFKYTKVSVPRDVERPLETLGEQRVSSCVPRIQGSPFLRYECGTPFAIYIPSIANTNLQQAVCNSSGFIFRVHIESFVAHVVVWFRTSFDLGEKH